MGTSKTITTTRAKEICSAWHGGQWSAFYSFASTGEIHIPYILRYLQECEELLNPEYWSINPKPLTVKDRKELNSLKRYFLMAAVMGGFEITFKPHELYGYLIPYITGNLHKYDLNKIEGLKYPV